MPEKIDKNNFLSFVYDFYVKTKAQEINLFYEGEITHQITKAFTSLTEAKMLKDEEPNTVQKKVFHVMVECLQNISKHADHKNHDATATKQGRGIFLVTKNTIQYNVTTGNTIPNDRIASLQSMLENINSLDKMGLKKLYKQQIREGRLSDKGGAGLGFIDIAKKTGQKLDYHFIKIDDNLSFFILTSTIKRK